MSKKMLEQGRYIKALEEIREALEIATQLFGKTNPLTQQLEKMKVDLEKANVEILNKIKSLN
ncbi:MAG: hypothetical protein VYA34_08655 [Myxococcota bacterium]|nr:hypothetical protein [Myxococcota bacterium]